MIFQWHPSDGCVILLSSSTIPNLNLGDNAIFHKTNTVRPQLNTPLKQAPPSISSHYMREMEISAHHIREVEISAYPQTSAHFSAIKSGCLFLEFSKSFVVGLHYGKKEVRSTKKN